jgi:hypothetical protein
VDTDVPPRELSMPSSSGPGEDGPADERRGGAERRSGTERRNGTDRRTYHERELARRLPDEFAQAGGPAVDRITGLVSRHWLAQGNVACAELAGALLPVLEGLLEPATPVTESIRDRCEQVVIDWLDRSEF